MGVTTAATTAPKKVYVIGSLRNPVVTETGCWLREQGFDAFDDWHGVGPEADDFWQKYEQQRGRTYIEALYGHAARNTFEFDKRHIDDSSAVVLVTPAGKSGHLELGYAAGQGKPTFVLFESEPERWDVMYLFATKAVFSREELKRELFKHLGEQ